MKRTQLVERFTAVGRLRRRYAALMEALDAGAGRTETGDALGQEIVAPALLLDDPGRHELLVEVEITRARLFSESASATPLDGANALIAAEGHARHLDPGKRPDAQFLSLARSLIPALRSAGSFRTRAAVVAVALRAAGALSGPMFRVDDELEQVPELLDTLWERGDDDEARDLSRASRRHLQSGSERVRRRVLELSVRRQRPSVALSLLSASDAGANCPDPIWIELAGLVLAAGRRDAKALGFLARVVMSQPRALEQLEPGFRRIFDDRSDRGSTTPRRRPKKESSDETIDPATSVARRRLLAALSLAWPDRVWPRRESALLEFQRGRHPAALMSFAEAMERGLELDGPTASVLALTVRCLGYPEVAAEIRAAAPTQRDDPGRRLAELIELAESGCTSPELHEQLADALRQFPCCGALVRLVHRLRARVQSALGAAGSARHVLEALMSRRPDDADLASELAESALHAGQFDVASHYLMIAEAGGPTRRNATLRALLFEESDPGAALTALQQALDTPRFSESRRRERRQLLTKISSDVESRSGGGSGVALLQRLMNSNPCELPEPLDELELHRRGARLAARARRPDLEARFLEPFATAAGAATSDLTAHARASLAAGEATPGLRSLLRVVRRRDAPLEAWMALASFVSARDRKQRLGRVLALAARRCPVGSETIALLRALDTLDHGDPIGAAVHVGSLEPSALSPRDARVVRWVRVRALEAAGRLAEAVIEAEALAQSGPADAATALLALRCARAAAWQATGAAASESWCRVFEAAERREARPPGDARARVEALARSMELRRGCDSMPAAEVTRSVESVSSLLPKNSEARSALTALASASRERGEWPDDATLVSVLSERDRAIDDRVLAAARDRERASLDSRQRLSLVLHRHAWARDAADDPAAPALLDEAHRAFGGYLSAVIEEPEFADLPHDVRRGAAVRIVSRLQALARDGAARYADQDRERAMAYAHLAASFTPRELSDPEAPALLADALLTPGAMGSFSPDALAWRLDLVLRVDPGNRVALRLLLRTQARDLARRLAARQGASADGDLEALDESVLRATPSVAHLSDEAEADGSDRDLANDLGLWHLGLAVVSDARGRTDAAVQAQAAARRWFERSGDPENWERLLPESGVPTQPRRRTSSGALTLDDLVDGLDAKPEVVPTASGYLADGLAAFEEQRFAEAERLIGLSFDSARRRADSRGVRAAIEALQKVRERRDAERLERTKTEVAAMVAVGRFRQALDRIQGLAGTDPSFLPSLAVPRIEAQLGLRRYEAAAHGLEDAAALQAQGHEFRELAPLRERCVLGVAALRIPGFERCWQALGVGDAGGALTLLQDLRPEHRSGPEVAILRARALIATRMPSEALRAARQAETAAPTGSLAQVAARELVAELSEKRA